MLINSNFILPKWHSDKQKLIYLDPRNIVCLAGRQCGKTESGINRMFTQAMLRNAPGLYWWIGYSWSSASMKRAWRLMKKRASEMWDAAGGAPSRFIKESRKEIILPGGIEFWLRTSLHPESLVGEGICGAVFDEFPLMAQEVWEDHVEPCLLRYNGWALFIGVPEGRNWASDLYDYAKSKKDPRWLALTMTTYDNPYINKAVLDSKRMRLEQSPTGSAIFRQRYLAEVLEDITALLTREAVEQCFDKFSNEWPRKPHREYFATVDPAGGGQDEYALAIGHSEKKRIVIDCIRAHRITQKNTTKMITEEFASMCRRYGVRQVYGDAYSANWVRDEFQMHGVDYERIPVTASECYLETMPMWACKEIYCPNDFPTKQQLLALQRRPARTKSGTAVNSRLIITHPSGGHDDRANVVSLLAYGLKNTITSDGGGYYFGGA